MQYAVLFHWIETTNWQAAEQIIKADRDAWHAIHNLQIQNILNQIDSNRPPRYGGLVLPLYGT
jgi:hypothetical protein